MTELTKLGSTLKVDDGVKVSYLPYGTWRSALEVALSEVTIYSVDTKSIVFDGDISNLINTDTGLAFTVGTFETFVASFNSGSDSVKHLQERVIVSSPADLQSIDSTKFYFIDGVVDFTGSGLNIDVSSSDLYIGGYGAGNSRIICTDDNYTLFTGGSNIAGGDMTIDIQGTNSKVFGLVANTGFEAIEFTNLNYENCSSLGFIDGYRQGLEENTARFGGSPTLEFRGNWLGGYAIITSIVRNIDPSTTTLFTDDGTLLFNSRFRCDANVDLPTGTCSLLDFMPSDFAGSNLLQLKGMLITRNGLSTANDPNVLPNINENDLEADFANNVGINNTIRGGRVSVATEVTTTNPGQGVFVDLEGTFSAIDLVHMDDNGNPTGGQLRQIEDQVRDYRLTGNMVIESQANNTVSMRLRINRGGVDEFTPTVNRVVNSLQGGRDVAYFTPDEIIKLGLNDFVTIQVANQSNGTQDMTAEESSYYKLYNL